MKKNVLRLSSRHAGSNIFASNIISIMNVRSGYWHPGSEQEIKLKKDLSITTDATYKADPY